MKKRLCAMLVASALLCGLAACGSGDKNPTPAPGAEGKFTAGTYTGEAQGFGGHHLCRYRRSGERRRRRGLPDPRQRRR